MTVLQEGGVQQWQAASDAVVLVVFLQQAILTWFVIFDCSAPLDANAAPIA